MSATSKGTPGPRLWISVLTFQASEGDLERCLASIAAARVPSGGLQVCVVDNASPREVPGRLKAAHPEVLWHRNEVNLGFAGGANTGLALAIADGAELVVLLNMDTTVAEDCLVNLVAAADRYPDAAIVGARLLSADGRLLEFDGRQFDPVLTAGGYANRSPEVPPPEPYDAPYACGAGMLVRADALGRTGWFDEAFFAYHEDVELALRAWRCGYRVLNAPRAVVYHRGGGSGCGTRFRDHMGLRNVVLTLLKHYDPLSWSKNAAAVLDLLFSGDVARSASLLSAAFALPSALRWRRSLGRCMATYSDVIEMVSSPWKGRSR